MMPALCARCGREFAEGVSACPRCGWALGEPEPAAPATPFPAAGAPPSTFFRPPAPPSETPQQAAAPLPLETELPARRTFTRRDGLVMLGGALGLVAIWYLSPSLFGRRQAQAPPAEQAAPAPAPPAPAAPAPPKPRLSAEEREAAAEALKPLKALQAATATGLKYAEYEARALETKSRVEPLLQTRSGDAEIKRYVREALDLYLLALSTWAHGARKEWEAILADPRIDLCAAVRAARDSTMTTGDFPPEQLRAMTVAGTIPQMWECAAGRISTIEGVLGEK